MNKINHTSINRSNQAIWAALNEGIKKRNWAIIEQNLNRIYELQKYYMKLLHFQEIENNQLKDLLEDTERTLESYQNEWLTEMAKKTNNYEDLKRQIDKTFRP